MISYNNKKYICFLDLGMDILRKKWNSIILCHIHTQPTRFTELQKKIPTISQKILSQSLKELETGGFISKMVYPVSPPKVEYSITPKGHELMEILMLIEKWSEKYYKIECQSIA